MKRVKNTSIFLLVVCLGYFGSAQRKYLSCTVSDDAGDTLRGYISNYKSTASLLKGFKLYDINKKKTKIRPDEWDNVEIDTVHYRSVRNQEGDYRFMKKIAAGSNAVLCLEREQFFEGTLPGEVPSTWFRNRYYLFRKGHWLFVDQDRLLRYPKYFFPNAPELCQKIKNTSKEDIAWIEWVDAYNTLDLNTISN